ncbi:Ku protein [Paraburkholderia sp. MMS20-SJTN17]|uniref:Non-homologous end joining protein Ku n=1 Tax=Paraburkholderia translucens TaxID=2886945 RepID=A0ABS8KM67_9BURK|nr:Ku protein [Paraburkholderia sp. MMS20-SJTN17]MCC8405888.1 Ku protein [Paraburkholderia sp. MMS20-SJTN17]
MTRAIWRGGISFGLVYVPVQIYPATTTRHTSFSLLDKHSIDPIGYRQINKRTGKEVARENIVRGFEYEKGKYVVLDDDEIRAANPESTQTVDILAFVDASEISFLYLDTPYYLVPERRGEKTYALLRDALSSTGRIGIASVVLHSKQHLAALVAAGGMLALDTLRWSDEVRPLDGLRLPDERASKTGVTARELDMAKKLIDDMTTAWNPDDYHDTFHDKILALVDRKIREGKTREVGTIEASAAPSTRQTAEIVDLSELLRRSLGRRNAKGGESAGDETGPAELSSPRSKRRATSSVRRSSQRTTSPRSRRA